MGRGRIAGRGLALIVAAGVAGSLIAAPAIADDGGSRENLKWGECPAEVAERSPSLECASVPVPLDYDEPDGKKIKIKISRIASQDPKRRGVLMLNPGGPGGAGLTQPADLVALGIPNSVLAGYDLIGMDPRGVGHSAPVSCGFTNEQDYRGNIPPFAADGDAVAEQAKAAEAVAEQCAANDDDQLMQHISTANTARDMDRIRAALGEQKLNYFGVSYGTALGSAYASMFAERAGRVVLDSNTGTTALDYGGLRRFGVGAEDRFPDFAEFAAERHASYGLGRTPAAVRKNYLSLAEQLDSEPVAGMDGATFRLMVFVGLYSDASFPETAQLWQSLADSDAAAVRRGLDRQRNPMLPVPTRSGSQESADGAELSPYDNGWSAFLAVSCNDSYWPTEVDSYQRAVANDREQNPLFGAAAANIGPCAYWPREHVEPVEVNDEGPSNVLVLQNQRDPATPLIGGKMMRTAFGDRARLVSIDQGGHGAYVYDDNPCALNLTTRYLVEGELPDSDTYCPDSGKSGLSLDREAKQQRVKTLERLGLS